MTDTIVLREENNNDFTYEVEVADDGSVTIELPDGLVDMLGLQLGDKAVFNLEVIRIERPAYDD